MTHLCKGALSYQLRLSQVELPLEERRPYPHQIL